MKDFPEYVYAGEKEKEEKHTGKELEQFIQTLDNCVLETLGEYGDQYGNGLRQYRLIELVKWKVPSSERQVKESLERLEEANKIIRTVDLTYKIRSES